MGRLGLEWYYTGQQRLEANPYRQTSRPYMLFGVLVEKRFGHARLFVNGENLGNVKQTNWDPLLRPTRGIDGRWLTRGRRLTAAISMAACACSSEPADGREQELLVAGHDNSWARSRGSLRTHRQSKPSLP
jgi:hypothetical protein